MICSFLRSKTRSVFLLSLKILPSFISMIRSANSAICASCVTMMMVWPSLCSAVKICITVSPLLLSSAPVGSSAKITSPPFIRARAILTRCCCPPLSLLGKFLVRSPSSSLFKSSTARLLRSLAPTPAYTAGSETFAVASIVAMRLYF